MNTSDHENPEMTPKPDDDQTSPRNSASDNQENTTPKTTHSSPNEKQKSRKKYFWLILLLVPVIGALGAYQFLVEERAPRINPLHLIPSNAMFVLETDEPYKAWKMISNTSIWSSLKKDDEWEELGEQLDNLDNSLSEYESIIDIIGNRTVYISAHPYRRSNHDYLIVLDTDGIPAFQNWVTTLGTTTRRTFKGVEIYELLDTDTKDTFYYSFIDGF
ncbi:MAG: hypothetical protein WBA74_17760 [Cyclobacteriaceae bacterium]